MAGFPEYRVPRFSDLPVIETVLLDRKDIPSVGAGECPMIGLAPAIANAIYDATATRLRALPLVPNGLEGKLRVVSDFRFWISVTPGQPRAAVSTFNFFGSAHE